jgi:hypothetical protein
MKKGLILFLSALVVLFSISCSNDTAHTTKSKPEVNITTAVNPADGLDFKLVGALFQDGKVKDAASLEQELNKEGGINNLDLNGDGKIDFINVSENQGTATAKSFDLTTGKDSETTYIGTVEVEKGKEGYNIHMSGSEQIYGANHSYTAHHGPSVGEMMFYAWLFSPRPIYYHTPYYMGHYPTYYGGPRVVVSRTVYANNTASQRTTVSKSVTKSTKPYVSKTKSQNKGKMSQASRTSINNHKTSQKSLQARQSGKEVKKGGFTKNKAPSTSKSTASKSSSSKSSGSSWFSSGKSSSSSKSSPSKSSWGSSSRSSSSRSFSSGGRRSDVNAKQDIVAADYGLQEVLALNAVTYSYTPEFVEKESLPATTQVGLIAQDVEIVVPEVVTTDANGLKYISYDLLVPVLIKAIQEQQATIDSLKLQLQ